MTRRVAATATLTVSPVLGSSALVVCGNSDSAISTKKVDAESTVLSDNIVALESLIDSLEAIVVSSAGPVEQRRTVGITVAASLPMLVVGGIEGAEDDTTAKSPEKDVRGRDTGADIADVEEEIGRLGAKTVFTVGAVDLTGGEGRQITADPDTTDGLKEPVDTELKVLKETESKPTRVVAEMNPEKSTIVEGDATKDEVANQEAQDRANDGQDDEGQESAILPKGLSKEVKNKLTLAAPGTGLASIVTARVASLKVSWLPVGDARATSKSIFAARDGESLIALGKIFGDKDKFDQLIKLAKDDKVKELLGGGMSLSPGHHLIATHGHPGIAPLGMMDEDDPEDAAARAEDYVKQYEKFVDGPMLPAFEIIASAAQVDPGPRGDYFEPAPIETLKPYIEAMTKAGGYVTIDLQPGSADLLDQAKFHGELPKIPNVGLALDLEWKMEPGQVPATQVSYVKAEEVNRVADWLAELTRKNNLSQKMLMLHQSQLQMVRDRETPDLSYPELAFVLHADGHGILQKKFETWNVMLQDLQPKIFEVWKNLIDEDQPMFISEGTMNIEPRPWLVTYQQVTDQQK